MASSPAIRNGGSVTTASIIVPCSRQKLQSHFHPRQTCPVAVPIKCWVKIGIEIRGKLAAIAKQHLTITATSVFSEQLFSKAGVILTERRNTLSGERLSRLIFLSSVGEE
jgi:hypothetical protein